jgi:hypothetical protein
VTFTPDWLTAFATILLAITAFAAIFKDVIRDWFTRPKFSVIFEAGHPDCHVVRLDWRTTSSSGSFSGSAPTHYVRCRVHNTGNAGAKDVEVAVIEVRQKDAAGNFRRRPMGTPWNLVWAHYNTHFLPQLPPGAERHIAIGHVVDPASRRGIQGEDDPSFNPASTETLFCLELFVKSNTLEYLLRPGEYQIDFQVSAANARPSRKFTLYLNHTGTWFPDEQRMYSDGLGLKLLP